MMSGRRAFRWEHSRWWHFILPAAEVSLNKCWLSVFLIRDFLLPAFGGSKFCTLIIYLFSAFICCVKVCKICIDRKVTDWFALYVSEVFRRSVTHINHSIIFIRIILHYLLVLLFLLILCKFCASAVICLAGICQKYGANSVLVPKICNNSFHFIFFLITFIDFHYAGLLISSEDSWESKETLIHVWNQGRFMHKWRLGRI